MGVYHGGAAWGWVGEDFRDLSRREGAINADVLDAWFEPAPGVIRLLRENLEWLCRTSPPVFADGLVREISGRYGLDFSRVVVGAGSSDLIFLALRQWLSAEDTVALIDPTYGEYGHVVSEVIGARIVRVLAEEDFQFDLDRVGAVIRQERPKMLILVNPNSPTGQVLPRSVLEEFLRSLPEETLVWVDETYVEYVGLEESVQGLAGEIPNLVVCKSLSKVLALSGLRAGYLVAREDLAEGLRKISPPWSVSCLAQGAAIEALRDPGYYALKYAETHVLREQLAGRLVDLGLRVVPGRANFLLTFLPESGPDAKEVIGRCAREGVYFRDAGSMGSGLGERAIRVAVKGEGDQERMVRVLAEVL